MRGPWRNSESEFIACPWTDHKSQEFSFRNDANASPPATFFLDHALYECQSLDWPKWDQHGLLHIQVQRGDPGKLFE